MAKIPIIIGSESFPTKAAALTRCREILWSYKPGEAIRPEHDGFLRSLIERHPSADRKIGCGIASLSVEADSYGGQGFWITRENGSRTDFSFRWCITPRPPQQEFKAACRTAVADQVLAFRDSAFGRLTQIACAFSGVMITRGESHVDHTPPDTFALLLERFLVDSAIAWESVPILGREDGSCTNRIGDPEVLRLWREYHRKNARLRVVSERANLIDIPRANAGSL